MEEELKNKLNEMIDAINKIGEKCFEYEEEADYFYGSETEKRTYTKSDWENIKNL